MFNISVDDKKIKIDKSLSIRDFSKKYFNNNHIIAAKVNGRPNIVNPAIRLIIKSLFAGPSS